MAKMIISDGEKILQIMDDDKKIIYSYDGTINKLPKELWDLIKKNKWGEKYFLFSNVRGHFELSPSSNKVGGSERVTHALIIGFYIIIVMIVIVGIAKYIYDAAAVITLNA